MKTPEEERQKARDKEYWKVSGTNLWLFFVAAASYIVVDYLIEWWGS